MQSLSNSNSAPLKKSPMSITFKGFIPETLKKEFVESIVASMLYKKERNSF